VTLQNFKRRGESRGLSATAELLIKMAETIFLRPTAYVCSA